MKMSDVFDLSDDSGIGFPAYWSDDKVRMASKAIYNHDTLTETNRLLNLECEELKGDVERLNERVKKLEDCLENFLIADEMIGSGMNVHGGMSMMTGNMDIAKQLLDK